MKKVISLFLAALMILTMLAVPVFASDYPAEEEIEKIFRMMGVSTWGSGYFGCSMMNPDGDNVPDSVVHQYIQSAGLLKEYEYEREVTNEYGTYPEYGYELPYDTYIGIIDDTFVNHSDMKTYLNGNEYDYYNYDYYDEETGIVSWPTGGFGGPSDWKVQEIYYASEELIYVTGMFIEYGYEDEYFDGMTENIDYIVIEDENFGDNKAEIVDDLVLTLKNVDGKWKILEYREISYHIVDDVLYDSLENTTYNRLTLDKTGVKISEAENSKDFSTHFYANGSGWYQEGAEISYEITARKSYEIKNVILEDADGTTEIKGNNGIYVISPKGTATLFVETEKIPVEIKIEKAEANEVIKVSESKTEVFAVVDQKVSDITSSVAEEVEILKADGTKAEETDKIASGMQIVVKDEDGVVIDTKTVVVPGDVDGDAEIKASDARSALRASVGLDELNSWGAAAADVDGADSIKAADARNILRASVGLEDSKEWLASVV